MKQTSPRQKISYFPTKFQGKILATSKTKAKVISILLLVLLTKDDYSQCLALHNVPQISVRMSGLLRKCIEVSQIPET